MKKILLLGSGELGKEFVISAQRKGQYIIACDSYARSTRHAGGGRVRSVQHAGRGSIGTCGA